MVQGVLYRLHEAHERAPSVGPWAAWAGWAVKQAVDEARLDRSERLATECLFAQIRREKDEARGGLTAFLAASGCGSLREWLEREESTRVDGSLRRERTALGREEEVLSVRALSSAGATKYACS